MANHGGNYWKGVSEHGTAAFLSTENLGNQIYVLDATTGEVLDVGTFDKTYEDGRRIYRFKNSGKNYSNIVIASDSGKMTYIPNGADLYWNLDFTQAKSNSDSYIESKGGKVTSRFDTATFPTSVSTNSQHEAYDPISQEFGIENVAGVAKPILLNSEDFKTEFTDPVETIRQISEINKEQYNQNFQQALVNANLLSDQDLQQLQNYLNTMSPLQQQLVGIENQFNQQQKLQAAETAMPGISNLLRGEIKNAQTLASGRLLSGMEDKALEDTARNAAADQAWARGLGDSSLVGKRLSDQLTLTERLNVMNQGQNYMSNAVKLASDVLMDTPNKAALSQQIQGSPRSTISDITNNQLQQLNTLTTMSPESVQNSIINQRQFQTKMDYDVATANLQAMNTFNQDVINSYNQTEYSNSQRESLRLAAIAEEQGWLGKGDYEEIKAMIESTGSADMNIWVKDWNKKYNDYLDKINNSEQGRINSESSTNGVVINEPVTETSGIDRTNEPNEPNTDINNSINTTYNKVLNSNGNEITPIINTRGIITIPDRNALYSGGMTYMQYIQSELSDIDLSGVII